MTFREELEAVLEKQLNILMNLKEISFLKTDMIINNHIQELEKITRKEESLINEMALLEEERERLLDSWGIVTSISNIIEKIPEDNSGLVHIRDRMKEALEELHLRNKLNNDLIQENLDWIDFNINLITSTHTHPSYGRDNKKPGGNSIFDRKV